MATFNISRIFEISKALATKSGQELADFIRYMALLAEQCIRLLRNGLTFRENFAGEEIEVSLVHDTAQVVAVGGSPVNIVPGRALTTTDHIDSFGWYINENSQVVVHAKFLNAPSSAITVRLMVHF